jgi:hypothetical protein
MPDDPYDPDWRPEFTGETTYGDLGTGADGFGVALYDLYHAGRRLLPQTASTYSVATGHIHRLKEPFDAVLDNVPGVYWRAHGLLKQLRGNLHDVLRLSSIHIEETGRALVEIAAAYATTDEEAADKFRAEMDDHSDLYDDPPIVVPEPPQRYDPPYPPGEGSQSGSNHAV